MKSVYVLNVSLALLISVLLFSCSNKIEKVNRAFYYWKNNEWRLSDSELVHVNKLGVKKLYVKFFEVDNSDAMGNYPVAKTSLDAYSLGNYKLDSLTIIPTIFINNSVFIRSNTEGLDELAKNVSFLVNKYCNEKFKDIDVNSELQIDCDWTLKSKENYFYFLKKVKEITKRKISCTLRLYPYKYASKMGVPPVDKATLMCYNLLSPLENHRRNSILDTDELKSYLNKTNNYPLHLDVALPIYSWMQVYQNNVFSKVIYADARGIKSLLKKDKPLWYEVTKDTVLDNFYMRIGDKVKLEEMSSAKINEAISIIKDNIDFDSEVTITLFHLDEKQINQFTNEELTSFYSNFCN